jgi:son of sevenless-like protein
LTCVFSAVTASTQPLTPENLKELLDGTPLPNIDLVDPRYSPWYLRTIYGPDEILFHMDGSVKGGTVSALVTRLTSHEYVGKRNVSMDILL